jgi:two-component system chemotaxis response regulator CheB
MNGLEALVEIRKTHPKLPVIMFSTLTERGAATTIDALSLGASDYVTKPANVGSVAASIQQVRDQLIPKIKALCARSVTPPTTAPVSAPRRLAGVATDLAPGMRIDAVAIGVSTGGPNALSTLFPKLPADLPVPVLVVQHMPPMFTRLLAERLAAQSAFPVREAESGEVIAPGAAWIAPGDHHMEVQREGTALRLRIHQGPHENSCRPAVDPLFRSVAHVFGAHALAIVLTGMGEDGLRGCQTIRDAGGQILAQDEASSVVWGMPGAVAGAGLADRVLPLDHMATEIQRRLRFGRSAPALRRPTTAPAASVER